MQIITLTSVGQSIASHPTANLSTPMRILYFLRRRGNQSTDEQIKSQLGIDGMQLRIALNTLKENMAIECKSRQ
jgi:transcription initiation factor IIE alpha subunit